MSVTLRIFHRTKHDEGEVLEKTFNSQMNVRDYLTRWFQDGFMMNDEGTLVIPWHAINSIERDYKAR